MMYTAPAVVPTAPAGFYYAPSFYTGQGGAAVVTGQGGVAGMTPQFGAGLFDPFAWLQQIKNICRLIEGVGDSKSEELVNLKLSVQQLQDQVKQMDDRLKKLEQPTTPAPRAVPSKAGPGARPGAVPSSSMRATRPASPAESTEQQLQRLEAELQALKAKYSPKPGTPAKN